MSRTKSRWRSERSELRAVVDTNVLVSGIAFPDGAPGRVLQALRAGDLREDAEVIAWLKARGVAMLGPAELLVNRPGFDGDQIP